MFFNQIKKIVDKLLRYKIDMCLLSDKKDEQFNQPDSKNMLCSSQRSAVLSYLSKNSQKK